MPQSSLGVIVKPQPIAKYGLMVVGATAVCGVLLSTSSTTRMIAELCAYVSVIAFILTAIAREYGSVINPFSYFALLYGLQTVFAPLAFYSAAVFDPWDSPVIEKAILYSAAYLTAVGLAFLIPVDTFNGCIRWALNRLTPRFVTPSLLGVWAVRLQIVASFAMLVYTSHTTEWFTNPRAAYSVSRQEGAGLWWALTEALLLLHFVLVLSRRKFLQTKVLVGRFSLFTLRVSPLLITCLLCALPAYFLGSKAMMLSYFVIGIFYYHWTVRPLSAKTIPGLCLFAIAGIFGLQLIQGTAQSFFDAVMYFDYFRNTVRFLGDFTRYFEHTWGANMLSELWFYVPRAVYPAKPKVFGGTAIMDVFYPGAVDVGSTPGILPWASAYLDFALPGVIGLGLFKGFLSKAAFRVFLDRRDISSLIVLAQIGFIMTEMAQFFYTAPLLIFWIWMVSEIILIRFCNNIAASLNFNS